MSTGALVPALRPSMATSGLLSGEPVSARDWAVLGALANYCNGRGAMLIPWSAIGCTISSGTTGVLHFFVAPKITAVERVWAVNLRASAAGASAIVTCGGASAVTVYPPTARDGRTGPFVIREQISAKTVTSADVTVSVRASGGNIVVESLAMYEQTRYSLALDTTDYGVDLGSLRTRLPIRDAANQSAAGVADAYKNLDARRAGLFYWAAPTGSAIEIESSSDTDLFPLQIPLQMAIQATGATTSFAALANVYAKVDSGSGSVRFTAASGDDNSFTINSTSFAWQDDPDGVALSTEDLTLADGRRGGTWETLRFRGSVSTATTLSIAAISVYITHTPL